MEMKTAVIIVAIDILVLGRGTLSQHCNSSTVGETKMSSTGNRASITGPPTVFLMGVENSDYIVQCSCGFITRWTAYIDDLPVTGDLYLQVWRKQTGLSYTLVGQNKVFVNDSDSTMSWSIQASERIGVIANDVIAWYSDTNVSLTYKSIGNYDVLYYQTSVVINPGETNTFTQSVYGPFRFYADLESGDSAIFQNLDNITYFTDDTEFGSLIFTVQTGGPVNSTYMTTSSSFFRFDNTTMQVTSSGALQVGTTTLQFEVTDNCANIVSKTLTVIVFNYPPVIHNLPASVDIREDSANDRQLYVLNVTDQSLADTVTCTMTSSPVFNYFYIRYETGTSNNAVYIQDQAPLSYVTNNVYVINVTCTDTKDTTSSLLTVNVLPNMSPTIHNLPGAETIPRLSMIGMVVYTVNATDVENEQLFFSLTCTATPCPFSILDSGQIILKESLQSHNESAYDVWISVQDNLNSDGPKSLTISISGLNTAPVITNLPIGVAVPENSDAGYSLYTVSFTDVDVNQSHSFSAVFDPPTAASYFNISQDGLVGTMTTLNFEDLSSTTMNITVYVSDGMSTVSGDITVTVTDVNEAPYFSSKSYSLVTFESSAGEVVGTPNFNVKDPDVNSIYTFSMDCDEFRIEPTNGTVYFVNNYDVDIVGTPTSVVCMVNVSDGELTDMASLTIHVDNINDNSPVFQTPFYQFFMSAGESVGYIVGSVSASDADLGTYGEVSYSLDQSSLGDDYFIISSTGEIYVTGDLTRFMNGSTFSLPVYGKDSGGLSATANITFSLSSYTTTTSTTTTDRYITFFEDTRNIAWFTVLMFVLLGLCLLILLFISRYCSFPKCEVNVDWQKWRKLLDCCKQNKSSKIYGRAVSPKTSFPISPEPAISDTVNLSGLQTSVEKTGWNPWKTGNEYI